MFSIMATPVYLVLNLGSDDLTPTQTHSEIKVLVCVQNWNFLESSMAMHNIIWLLFEIISVLYFLVITFYCLHTPWN